jgi:hypothetical protein
VLYQQQSKLWRPVLFVFQLLMVQRLATDWLNLIM